MSRIIPDKSLRLLSRAFAILELLGNGVRSMTEVSVLSGIPKGTVHRVLGALVASGYVRQEPNSDYVLTTKLYQVGRQAVYSLDVRAVARPHMENLAHEANETVLLAILDGTDSVLVDRVEAVKDMVVSVIARLGGRASAHRTATGKALLAHLSVDKLEDVVSQIPVASVAGKISPLNDLTAQLDQVRLEGYAVSYEEYYKGVISLAAPIVDCNGDVVAAICLAVPALGFHKERIPLLAKLVVHKSKEISQGLGAFDASASRQKLPNKLPAA